MWSWLLTSLGLLAMWLVPKRPALGWSVGLLSEAVWMAYAVVTHQTGFIIGAVAYGCVYGRNLRKALRENSRFCLLFRQRFGIIRISGPKPSPISLKSVMESDWYKDYVRDLHEQVYGSTESLNKFTKESNG